MGKATTFLLKEPDSFEGNLFAKFSVMTFDEYIEFLKDQQEKGVSSLYHWDHSKSVVTALLREITVILHLLHALRNGVEIMQPQRTVLQILAQL
ncbi:hypothetical protein Dimus_022701, partial [Dionaea muscipula]